jgi:hypothetical protein
MRRYLVGLLTGLAGGGLIVALNLATDYLVTPLVGILVGLVIGMALGWRRHEPGKAVADGLLAGMLAGALLLIGELVGTSLYMQKPHASVWAHVALQRNTVWWLTGATGVLSLLLATSLAMAFAGIVSAWTGYRTPQAA